MLGTDTLQSLMQQAGVSSYRALATQAGVSRWQVQQLRQGKVEQMRLATLQQISSALNLSLVDLLVAFTSTPSQQALAASPSAEQPPDAAAFQKEYDRLQAQLTSAKEVARQALQKEALDTLESWLIQWPTIAHRAQENESLAAAKVVKFVEPVTRMVESWGVSAIAPVGTTLPYDPQRHQLKQGAAQPGDTVEVISPGYTYQGKLLHRASVKPYPG